MEANFSSKLTNFFSELPQIISCLFNVQQAGISKDSCSGELTGTEVKS